MLRSSWRLYAAFGAAFVGFLVGLWVAYVLLMVPYQNGQERERQVSAELNKREAYEYAEWACVTEPEAIRHICVSEKAHAYQSQNRAAHDLKAQQDMSASALGVLIVSVFGLFISAGGLGALIWTFREQRELSLTQARAWVGIEVKGFEVTDPSLTGHPDIYEFRLKAEFFNMGSTSAFNFRSSSRIMLEPWPLREDFFDYEFPEPTQHGSILPSQKRTVTYSNHRTVDLVQVRAGAQRLVLHGIAFYTDAFGRERFVRFCGSLINLGQWLDAVKKGAAPPTIDLQWSEKGNDAN